MTLIVKLHRSRAFNRWKSYTDSRWNRAQEYTAPAFRLLADGTRVEVEQRDTATSRKAGKRGRA